jgi:hypothetical protein
MIFGAHYGLPRSIAPGIMRVWMARASVAALCLVGQCVLAQEKPQQRRDELDVTMQIIVDPDAKLPDEVVRKIPLPARRTGDPQKTKQPSAPSSDDPAKEQERSREARELGNDMAERANDKQREAAEQREDARRAEEQDERERGPPDDPPGGPPSNPPGGPPNDSPGGPPNDPPGGPPNDPPGGPPSDPPGGPPSDPPAGPPEDVPRGPPADPPRGPPEDRPGRPGR